MSRFFPLVLHVLWLGALLHIFPVHAAEINAAPGSAAAAEVSAAMPRVPLIVKSEPAEFRGNNRASVRGGAAGGMTYQGGALGSAVGILIQAAISSAAESAEERQNRANAEIILRPFLPVVRTLNVKDMLLANQARLQEKAAIELLAPEAQPKQGVMFLMKPVFFMTADHRGLIVENRVQLYKLMGAETQTRSIDVRVVMPPLLRGESTSVWLDNDGARLRTDAAEALTRSVMTAADFLLRRQWKSEPTARTIRYLEGKSEQVERVFMMVDGCESSTMETLDGSLLVAHLKRHVQPEHCRVEAQAAANPAGTPAATTGNTLPAATESPAPNAL